MQWTIPDKIVQRGRQYVEEKRVVSITQDLEENVWYADVIGSKIYQVELDGSPKEKDKCTCPYWQERGYCKHTVAVELALREKGYSRVLANNTNLKTTHTAPTLSKLFTDSFSKLQEKDTEQAIQEKTPLRMEILIENLEISNYHPEKSVIALSLKVGLEKGRVYVVKHIGEFLQAYEEKQQYKVNEQYSFYMAPENFSKKEQEILSSCLEVYHAQQLISSSGMQIKGTIKQRYLPLPDVQAKKLIQTLQQENLLTFKIHDQLIHQVFFTEESLPIKFYVTPYEEGFLLTVNNNVEMYWASYQWIFSKGIIYQLSHTQEEVYVTLLQLLKRVEKPEIYYKKSEVADLFAYVIPSLELIGEVCVEESLQTEMIQVPLKSKIILREEKGKVVAQVDFCYSDIVFSTSPETTSQEEKKNLVVRNQVQEKRLESILDHYGYSKRKTGFIKNLPKKQELFLFFTEEIPKLKKVATVEVEGALNSLYLEAVQYQPKIEIKEDGSWLDVHFDISNIEESEVDAIMLSLINQEKYHQFANGQILSLDSEAFQQTSEALQKLRQHLVYRDGGIEIPKYRSLQVQEALGTIETTSFSEDFSKIVQDLTHPHEYSCTEPKKLQATLREYQKDGFRWLKMLSHHHFGGILADEMGLGKTLQGITYILSEKEEGIATAPSLVVAPASLIYNWQIECEKFAPDLRTLVITGSKQERTQMLKQGDDYDLLITSYAGIRQDIEWYETLEIHCLILDEAQMIKNAATKTFQAIKGLHTQHRFAFSGTPIENNLEELWSLFYMLMPGFFPVKSKFKSLKTHEVAKMIQPFVLRREKKEVLKDLPDKIENNLYSQLTEEQKTVYLAHLRQMQQDVSGMDKTAFRKNHLSILAGLTRLRQICCDPKLFLEDYTGDSGKLEQVKELVVAAKENKRRLLIFSQFTSMLSIIEKELNQLGVETFYLRGSTKPKDRMKMVEEFNEGQKDVFLISLKAGGTGLNLTGADTVILYDLWWNPAVEEQAAGRAHRMGQKKVVEVWRLIAEGTIEEKINQLQQEKKELFQQVLNADENQELSKLTEEDIREILSIGTDT